MTKKKKKNGMVGGSGQLNEMYEPGLNPEPKFFSSFSTKLLAKLMKFK